MDGGDKLRVTLSDRMSTAENSTTGSTLEAILMADKNRISPQPPQITPPSRNQSNRTLLDVMTRHDPSPRDNKTPWKSLCEKLKLKRNGAVWISSNPIPDTNRPIPVQDNDSHGFHSGRVRLSAVLAEERALSAREEEEIPARMSLMELLEENQGKMSFVVDDGEGAEEERGGGGGGGGEAEEIGCCVCMVRSKGAAFIPCGHTFCRLCSRELWVKRGNCPLCNTSIVQVLDLF
ncbi:unnamed protein product [Cochlearia groenlandica]